jgi:Zn-dependent peptidase ImmA (M78 family)
LGLGDDQNFFVAIDKELSPAKQAMSLGHELAHTFHHDLKTTPPTNILPESQREEVEEFCKLFAGQWLQKVGVDGIAKRFENESELIVIGTVFALPIAKFL